MLEGFEIIRAKTKDDAAILIDRLMRSKYPEVVLVLPKNSILAADLNSIKILKEEAGSVDKKLFISTENNEIKKFAEKIQLPIYNPNSPKREKELKRMLDIVPPSFKMHEEIGEPLIEPEPNPEMNFIPQQEPVIYEITNKNIVPELNKNNDSELEKDLEDFYNEPKSKSENKFPTIGSKRLLSFNRIVVSFVCIGVLLLATAMYLILPKANIKLSLKEIPIKVAIPVAISKNISLPDFANGIIPGQYFLLSKSGSKTIETSNESGNSPLKTGGFISIYNAYSTAPQKLVAQTRFETKDGKIFRIQNPVIVPGAKMSGTKLTPSSIKVEVVSDAAGKEHQIGPSYFTIPGFKGSPKYAGFYAESIESMIPIQNSLTLSNQEIEKTKKNLEDALVSELKNDTLNTFKDSDLKLIDGASTVKINDFKADSQTISMKITWQAIFFKEKDFRALVDYSVSDKYPDLKNFDFKDNIAYPQAAKSDFKKGEIFFTFELDKANAFAVDLAEFKKELVGLDENGMRNVITNKNFINSATISLWPFWVKQAPGNPDKINITLDKQ
ncbi:MAG: hypothetical protein NTV77_00520 [Candidatus Azambacteria bacterium]|nr:hypothetical protein [Candidatus Azambacteria bacterium]